MLLPYSEVYSEEYWDITRGWEATQYDVVCAEESAEEACQAYFESENNGEYPSYEAWKNA